ncbi:MAG: helix-turn-helix domain-containing protein [Chloroflexi bacterium]|nr:helix-turn-helix domain-containing protein [Chloroflexota bacterium]
MKDYSLDLRQRIVQAVADGQPKTVVAQRFAVSLGSVKRYVRQWTATGTLAPRPRPGRPRAIAGDQAAALAAQVAADPSATLAEHCQQWADQHGVRVSVATMSRTLARAGVSRKKDR